MGPERAAPVESDNEGPADAVHPASSCPWITRTSPRAAYLKPSKLALHTAIQRIDDQRRASREAARWEQELAELRKNLPEGPQEGPHADRMAVRREAGKTATRPGINRLGA
jgi:hypothetical protein